MSSKNKKKALPIPRKSFRFGRPVKLIGVFAVALFLFYLSAGFLFDRSFLKRDIKEKYGRVAGVTTMVLRVMGPPEEPVLTLTPFCQNYSSHIGLSWTSNDQMDYFDIERNNLPLIAGVVQASYEDETVQEATDYTYAVTAFNSLGQKTSAPVSATALDCGEPPVPIDPTCVITKFHNTNLIGFSGTPHTTNRKPTFFGTTNIPSAIIRIAVAGKTLMIISSRANEGGYWQWKPQDKFNYGLHTFWVSAVDPADLSREKTASLNFEIEEREEGEEKKEEKEDAKTKKESPAINIPVPAFVPGAEENFLPSLSIKVKNPGKVAHPGENLLIETKIKIQGEARPEKAKITYGLFDKKGEMVFETNDDITVRDGAIFEKEIRVPRFLKSGRHKVIAKITYEGTIISAEDDFMLREIPLANLGSGVTLTVGQIMDNLLWVIIGLLILLLILLILLLIEYWTSQRAIIQITEEILNEKGFVREKR